MSGRGKVVVTDFINDSLECERRILGDLADVVALNARNQSELVGQIEDADAVMMYLCLTIGESTIHSLKNCKLIVRCGVGFDNVDRAAARRYGIDVATVPDYGTEDVADTALGMALTLSRGIHLLNSRLRRSQGPWSYTQVAPVSRLRGQNFGIIGIAKASASNCAESAFFKCSFTSADVSQ